MTFRDEEKVKRLNAVFSLNFKITEMYALYLERFPEVINSEMMTELCSGGDISEEAGIVALLAEIFGISADRSAEDRRIIRDYLTPSVRILDSKKYTENPYYRNIKIRDVKDGNWELKQECYPAYRGMICHDMMLLDDFREVPPLGFFREDFHFPAVLEGGNEWMTLTPVDLDTCEEAIRHAHGRVVTFGLGLGYYAYMASIKDDVDSVTVIEKSEDVIRLFKKHIFPQFPHPDKVNVICADAFEYAEQAMPSESFDLAFVDTWRDASDGAYMYARMKGLERLSPNTEFIYWIENFLISRHRALAYCDMMDKLDAAAPDAPKSYEEIERRLRNPLSL